MQKNTTQDSTLLTIIFPVITTQQYRSVSLQQANNHPKHDTNIQYAPDAKKKQIKRDKESMLPSIFSANCYMSQQTRIQQYNLLRGKSTRLQKKKEVRRNTVTFLPNHPPSPPFSSPSTFQYSMPSNRDSANSGLRNGSTDQSKPPPRVKRQTHVKQTETQLALFKCQAEADLIKRNANE
jgi:hypothetical protein